MNKNNSKHGMNWIIIGIPVGVLLWGIIIYKRFINLKYHALEAWCGIDRQSNSHPQYRISILVMPECELCGDIYLPVVL
jgi:hypothetical protein